MRGEIALIRKGTGQIVGVADLVDSLSPLDGQGLADSVQFHGVPPSEQTTVIANGWLFPWLIINARRLSSPVPYVHPAGAVTWVNLDPGVARSVDSARTTSANGLSVLTSKVLRPARAAASNYDLRCFGRAK